MNTKKSQPLLYIVRNNFKSKDFGFAQHSILGVYTSLKKAYTAGHTKAVKVRRNGNIEHLELRVVRPNSYNYVGYPVSITFLATYSNKELKNLATEIQDWFRRNKPYIERAEETMKKL